MNFVSLLVHGLTAMSVLSDKVSARLLAASATFAVLAVIAIAVTASIRLWTHLAVPGWATYTTVSLVGLVLQLLTFSILFAFMIAGRRSAPNFILQRDAHHFILGRTTASKPEATKKTALRDCAETVKINGAVGHFEYCGSELALFEKATHWKAYWRDEITEFVKGDVLEVGAGIGANTKLLAGLDYRSWSCLEPDARLAAEIETPQGGRHRTVVGTIGDLPPADRFDTILYIDVLEHIEDDHAELIRASERLNPGGALIVLSPAHQFLYSRFDAGIGHFRRYTRASLRAAAPANLVPARIMYLDSAGMLASTANRLLLKSAMPTERQILTWDRVLVPASRVIDRVFAGNLGKTVLAIWRLAV